MRRLAVLAILAFGVSPVLPAHAASFDCARARTADERAVCADPRLSMLDSEMGALWYAYSRIPMLMGANGARHDEAQRFLADRAACGRNGACLARLYVARNAGLRREIDWALRNVTIK